MEMAPRHRLELVKTWSDVEEAALTEPILHQNVLIHVTNPSFVELGEGDAIPRALVAIATGGR
jgi:hypothetical protein